MKTNKRLFKVVLLISGVLMILGTGFLYAIRLDEPLFFHHYYDEFIISDEEGMYHDSSEFKYITNRYDERVIVGVSFPEQPDVWVQVAGFDDYNFFYMDNHEVYQHEEIYGYYSVRKVNWEIVEVPEEVNLNNTPITQVEFLFDDSSEMLVDIGEIYLSRMTSDESVIQHVYGSSSTDGEIETRHQFIEDATVISVSSPALESIPHTQSFKLNNQEVESLEGIQAEEEDNLTVSSVVLPSEENKYEQYKAQLQVSFINDDNEESQGVLQWIRGPGIDYEFFDLISYSQSRRGE